MTDFEKQLLDRIEEMNRKRLIEIARQQQDAARRSGILPADTIPYAPPYDGTDGMPDDDRSPRGED